MTMRYALRRTMPHETLKKTKKVAQLAHMHFVQHKMCKHCAELNVRATRRRARWHGQGGRLSMRWQ